MSQNAHTLTLFFEQPLLHRQFQLLLQCLQTGASAQAQQWADKLGGIDLQLLWPQPQSFNHTVRCHREHLVYRYETAPSGDLPWALLAHLSQHGLQAATLEVYYDQVGESVCFHIDRGQWVSHQDWLAAYPGRKALVDPDGEIYPSAHSTDSDLCELRDPGRPTALTTLTQQQIERERKADVLANDLLQAMQLPTEAREQQTKELVEALLQLQRQEQQPDPRALLGAGLKTLAKVLLATTASVLLFQGLWLWLGIGLVLAVILPLLTMARLRRRWNANQGDGDVDDSLLAAAKKTS